jgi:hypothetical protein
MPSTLRPLHMEPAKIEQDGVGVAAWNALSSAARQSVNESRRKDDIPIGPKPCQIATTTSQLRLDQVPQISPKSQNIFGRIECELTGIRCMALFKPDNQRSNEAALT